MSGILLPEGVDNPNEGNNVEELEYKATVEDEERFFLIYHLHIQPSEADNLSPQYRKWLIMRFIAQKHMEQDTIDKQRMIRQFGPDLSGLKGGA